MAELEQDSLMREAMEERGPLKLCGSIEHVIYSNEENGFAICDLGCDDDGELVTITGTLPFIGTTTVLSAQWQSTNIYYHEPSTLAPMA